MDLSNLTIRHGRLTALQCAIPNAVMRACSGRPRTWGDITIVAAGVKLLGPPFADRQTLAAFIRHRELPSDVRLLLPDGFDGSWVRGRIDRVFHAPSPNAEHLGEKSGLAQEFVAEVPAESDSPLGVPFGCCDHYLRTGLTFSGQEAPEVCDRVASAFWELLLAEPHNLPDYQDKLFHSGAGYWLAFGIRNGRPFMEEHEEEPR